MEDTWPYIVKEEYKRMQKAKAELIADANGHQCCDCAHSYFNGEAGVCTVRRNVFDEVLTIIRTDAVGCRDDYVAK